MAGVKGLRKIQFGIETTGASGTAVAATAVMRYTGMIEDARTVVFPEETVGVLGGTDRMYVPQYLAKCNIQGEATYEQLPYFFQAAFHLTASSADGVGTDKIWEWNAPTTSIPELATYTIETGDNQEAEEMEYSFVTDFTLSGKYGEAWMMDSNWTGRQATVAAFTGALTPPTVESCLFGKTKLYIDASTATAGTTVKSNTLLEASLKVTTGWVPVFTADGALYFSFVKNIGPEITLDITFEHDAIGAAQKVAWRAGTPQVIRLLCEGTSVATQGTLYTYKSLIVDLWGKWEKIEAIDEIDGNDVVKGTFRGRYMVDPGKFCTVTVANELTTLP